ncbi:DinB family protein [Dactylosporangium sp. NBC_01737]|uniref:DinB family protein n=1 Tax=Dactylosporangium sp. NBC_01737 TaxID=2975959 RepID=UPI002E12A69C|nr:DinB family protein [Dactylosporangium sp. NBC_01737]
MIISEATTLLARTPDALGALLPGLPDEWLHRDDGEGTWSAYAIAGHLLHGDATNWLPRIRLIVEHGTGRPFAPFNRVAMLDWEREPVTALLDRFRVARAGSLRELASLGLTQDDLTRSGTHPEFGTVTLEQVLAAWVAHDLTHLAQIGEVLAGRYRDEVGPYRRYMPALERTAPAE